ncbi:MAG TPA: glycogen/starch/alpha-glucan phosphorylase, partial [Kofleriaceae bacterium]|nr:glycogen/starch/alpha-glucan phosphorylase [Kofleriaceae bacterium]
MAEQSLHIEDDRTGMVVPVLRRAFLDNLASLQGKNRDSATNRDYFYALAFTVRDRLFHRWIQTQKTYYEADPKRVYYLSAEFLVGRSLANNLYNLGIYDQAKEALGELGVNLADLLEEEADAGLGNGGLGRLASCFLDSMATLALPGVGYGLRYEFGIFRQEIKDGAQVEHPDDWLRFGNPWEIARPEYTVAVRFGGSTERVPDGKGGFKVVWNAAEAVLGVPYDTPISGYKNDTVNTMRLWRARASEEFDLEMFNAGDYVRAVEDKTASENISKVLYPQDHSPQGKELRLRQQYFFVSCSIRDIMRRYLRTHSDFEALADKAAIQLNDTHPSIAIAELMRILVDENGLPWDHAFDITTRVCAYTNHTIMGEALERWPVALFERLLPRHLEIIYEINRRFLDELRAEGANGELIRRMSIIEEAGGKQVRMANLAVIGTHSTNGVAALHSRLLREDLFADFYLRWPERFNNKTNGVTPRRWILEANPDLSALITEHIGAGWITDLEQLRGLEKLADDATFRGRFRAVKLDNKRALARLAAAETGVTLDPGMMFDVQVKRLHEYKRQLLNVLHIIDLWRRIARDPAEAIVPRAFIFGAKAAPGYAMAKLIVRLINGVAQVVNDDPTTAAHLAVVFMPNYRVSSAEVIIPAADLSEQISTAGYEASGTGNMKLSLNGALTIGTLDGANVEIRQEVGAENFFLFGMTVEEVRNRRAAGYRPRDVVAADPALGEVIDLIRSGRFGAGFEPIVDSLLGDDRYLCLADFAAYADCQRRVAAAYRDQEAWSRMAILNVARLGKFSSDRAIAEYARDIWG